MKRIDWRKTSAAMLAFILIMSNSALSLTAYADSYRETAASSAAEEVPTDETGDPVVDEAKGDETPDSAPAEEPEETQKAEESADEPSDAPEGVASSGEETPAEPKAISSDQMEEEPVQVPEAEDEAVPEPVKRTYTYEDRDITVTATLEDPAAVPDEAEFVVTPVTRKTRGYSYDAYLQALNEDAKAEGATEDIYNEGNTLFYDVAFFVDANLANTNLADTQIPKDGKVEFEPEQGSVTITAQFKKAQLSDKLGAKTGEDLTIIHLPLTEEVRANVATTRDATDLTVDDIQVEKVDGEISLSEKKGDTAEFALGSLSLAAITTVETKVNEDRTGNLGTLTKQDLLNAIGVARDFSVFAKRFNNSNHMEGNIAAQTMFGCVSQLGNTDAVYQKVNNVEITDYAISVEKRLESGGNGSFKFGVFRDKAGQNRIGEPYTINVNNGVGSGTITGQFNNNSSVYVYELYESNGQYLPIINTDENSRYTINNQQYHVSYTNQFGAPLASTDVSKSSNTSFVEFFENPQDSGSKENMFNACTYEQAKLMVGPDNVVTTNSKGDSVITSKSNGVVYETGPNVSVTRLDQFPIDFEQAFSEYNRLSAALASAKDSNEIEVINVVGTQSTGSFPTDVMRAIGANNVNDMTVTFGSGQFLLINIDCTGLDSYQITPIFVQQGNDASDRKETGDWDTHASKIIINPYKRVGNTIVPFDGDLYLNKSSGTVLAPNASVNCHAAVVGSIIGREVAHDGCEIHKMTLEGMTAHGSVGVRNAPEAKLTLKKKVVTDGQEGIKPDNNMNPVFEISGPNGTYKRTYSQFNQNGTLEVTVPAGNYTVTELCADAQGYDRTTTYQVNSGAATNDSAKNVAVGQSNTQPVVEVTNRYTTRQNKTCLTLTKSFKPDTLNLSEEQKGKVRFTITGPNHFKKVVYYEDFQNGQYWVQDLEPGNYTVTEDNLEVENYSVTVKYKVDNNAEQTGNVTSSISLEQNQKKTVAFTNQYEAPQHNENSMLYIYKTFDDGANQSEALKNLWFEIRGINNRFYKVINVIGKDGQPENQQDQNDVIRYRVEQTNPIKIKVKDLPYGEYTVTEHGAQISGKQQTATYYNYDRYNDNGYPVDKDTLVQIPEKTEPDIVNKVNVTQMQNQSGNIVSAVKIHNTYKKFTPVNATITASKELSGRALQTGEFTFTVEAEDNADTTPLPSGSTATNNQDGTIDFGTIQFTKAGTYNYIIREVKGSDPDITYDLIERHVVVTVPDNNGEETVSQPTVTYQGSTNNQPPTFRNQYEQTTPDVEGSFNLHKIDGKTKGNWSAGTVTFTLTNKNSTAVSQTIGTNGEDVTFSNLTASNSPYTLSESHEVEGYGTAPNLTVNVEKNGTVSFGDYDSTYYSVSGSGEDLTLNVTNPEDNNYKLTLDKTFDCPSGFPMAGKNGTTFTINGPDTKQTINYSQFTQGKYELSGLKPGSYTVTEQNGVSGYSCETKYKVGEGTETSGTVATVTLSDTNRTEVVAFTNKYTQIPQKGNLTLTKTFTGRNNNNNETIPENVRNGVQFTITGTKGQEPISIYYGDERFVKTGNGSTGTLTLEDLEPDTYTVTESNADYSGFQRTTTYQVSDKMTKEVAVTVGETSNMQITNSYVKGNAKLILWKTNNVYPDTVSGYEAHFNDFYSKVKDSIYFVIDGPDDTHAFHRIMCFDSNVTVSEDEIYTEKKIMDGGANGSVYGGWETYFDNLPAGRYTVTEYGGDIEGYALTMESRTGRYNNTPASAPQRNNNSWPKGNGTNSWTIDILPSQNGYDSKMWVDNLYQKAVTIKKVDEEGNLIGGAKLKLATYNKNTHGMDDVTLPLTGKNVIETEEGTPVSIALSKIEELVRNSNGLYAYPAIIVSEEDAPTGYKLAGNVGFQYFYAYENNNPVGTRNVNEWDTENDVTGQDITSLRAISMVDERLPTGEFTLKKVGADGQPFQGGDVIFTLTNVNDSEDIQTITVKTDEGSTATVTGLTAGATYTLTETSTPPDYMKIPENKYTISVDADGNVTFGGLSDEEGYVEIVKQGADQDAEIKVTNYAYVDVPESGSRSALYCFILGSLLTLVGCYILFHRERGAE